MKWLFLLALLPVFLTSCGSSRNVTRTSLTNSKSEAVVEYAKSFNGTPYKFGGTTEQGMDCSGLVYVSFKRENISLPRISNEIARKGIRISLENAKKGDLLFFKTGKNQRKINHVGLIVEVKKTEIRFIHSTTSSGVIISSLNEPYWKNTFVEARKVI